MTHAIDNIHNVTKLIVAVLYWKLFNVNAGENAVPCEYI